MNKKMFASSLALVLAMTMVLAVGKTRPFEKADESPVSVQPAEPEQEMITQAVAAVPMVSSGPAITPVKPTQAVVIPEEIDENEMILSTDQATKRQILQEAGHPLLQSLARVEEALQHLEELASDAHARVAALEHQYRLR